ncbi:hypothetical protein SK128_008992 [Halocaridina rubra]|uniref:Uncharacterized protein n=1 Tax=Halocaridina rubra TaxID=373956 RepID=A0AAN9A3M3_HALRR
MTMEDVEYVEDTQELLETLPEAIPETEEEGDFSSFPENALEELPEPEAYRRRRPKPRPPVLFGKLEGPIRGPLGPPRGKKGSPSPNDFYKSSLDHIQKEKLPPGRGGVGKPFSEGGFSHERPSGIAGTGDPLMTDESWRWLSALISGNTNRRRIPNGRMRSRPLLLRPLTPRARNRQREILDKRQPVAGLPNTRRLPPVHFRQRTQRPTYFTRPRFREPTHTRQRPTPARVVTDPTTTTPDTLSVHNIAGPPYYDTIPPNILFVDEDVTTPATFPTAPFTSPTNPVSTSAEIWRPATYTRSEKKFDSTTPSPAVRTTRKERYNPNEAERSRPNYPTGREVDDNKWYKQRFPYNDLSWNVDTDQEWFNIWNHNWGDEWGRKWNTETTSKTNPTTASIPGRSEPEERIKWGDDSQDIEPIFPSEKDLFLHNHSIEEDFLEGTLQNHRLFEDISSDIYNYRESPEWPNRFSETSHASNINHSLPASVESPMTPGQPQRSPAFNIYDDNRDPYFGNSVPTSNSREQYIYQPFIDGNRRMSTFPRLVQSSDMKRNPTRTRYRPFVQFASEKSDVSAAKPIEIRHIARVREQVIL